MSKEIKFKIQPPQGHFLLIKTQVQVDEDNIQVHNKWHEVTDFVYKRWLKVQKNSESKLKPTRFETKDGDMRSGPSITRYSKYSTGPTSINEVKNADIKNTWQFITEKSRDKWIAFLESVGETKSEKEGVIA